MHTVRNGVCIFLLVIPAFAMANEQQAEIPRGSCTITVSGMTPACINYIPQDTCNERAQNSGATADWKENRPCPTPQEVMESRGEPISYQ